MNLSRKTAILPPGGKLQCRLMGLAQQEEAVSRALAGIAHLQGEQSRPSPVGWKEENFQRGLALCYRRSRKILPYRFKYPS